LASKLCTEGAEDILDEKVLRELLAAVDLEYLLERVGMHAAVNWHDTLSLGAPPLLSLSALLLPIVAILTPLHWAFAAGRLHLSMDPWLRAATVGGVCCEGILLMCVSPGQKAALRIACAVVRPHNTPDANFLCLSR